MPWLHAEERVVVYPQYALAAIARMMSAEAMPATGQFEGFRIGSGYQPIFSVAHGRAVGYEALLRGADSGGHPVTPMSLFDHCRDSGQIVLLDRLARGVHLRNFAAQDSGHGWLFLNVNPRVVVEGRRYGSFFRQLLDSEKFPPHRVVVEILEAATTEEEELKEAVAYYRDLGCLIAIDDFGAGHSNFDRIWRLRPDIVKFDRSIVAQAGRSREIRAIIPGMVSLVHEAGSLVLMEGIETEEEAMVAMEADAEFVQGYFFARPAPTLVDMAAVRPSLAHLFDQFKRYAALDRAGYRNTIAPYINGLGYASVLLGSGVPLESACAGFLELPRAEFCFLLDRHGKQIGANVQSAHFKARANPCFAPLKDATNADWSRRHYFRRALAQPDKVHVTRPYLSVSTASRCVTASIAYKAGSEMCVLCGDIAWDGQFSTSDKTVDPILR
jgi:EAL domain-containing protein (putative c-di-GMP-specific phosphodiesterase class I)